jgi:hypothetical protein
MFFQYFLAKPLYDSKDVLHEKTGDPAIEGLKELMITPGPVFDFIEKLAHQAGVHKAAFNGAFYSET